MVLGFYFAMFAISLVLVIVYSFVFHKHFDANLTILVVLVPVINLGFLLMGYSKVIEEALIGLRLTYIGGCYLLVTAMFLIFKICDINLKPWMRALILTISTAIYATTLTISHNDLFYKGMPTLAFYGGAAYITNKHYGPFHTIFYVMVGVYYAMTVAAIIYAFIRKRQVPRKILILISVAVSVAVFGFFGSRLIGQAIEILPATYNLGMIIYLIIASRLRLYDASDSVTDSIVEKGDTGFVSFDNKMRYLDSNETAQRMLPELKTLIVDRQNDWANEVFMPFVHAFEENAEHDKQFIKRDGKTYLVTTNHLLAGSIIRSKKGYQFFITDDTANQQYIELIKKYNSQLEAEVEAKTKNVIEMHEKLVLGMATMVEGRDNSTGGHIKRTSDCIRILIDEIKKDGSLNLSDKFCADLVKAAPMHDLGKIAVDDAILRKPGKYTPEEFEVMKSHAAEGARIVAQILEGTDDKEFAKIAVNVAHYHHERWDGSGYPKGLKGEEIPLEARIMAIADVYDALVSKRVYKEKMSFEQANQIIMDGMGKHFDKRLEVFYVAAREKLEDYYRNIDC